jgi:hypothetical protein
VRSKWGRRHALVVQLDSPGVRSDVDQRATAAFSAYDQLLWRSSDSIPRLARLERSRARRQAFRKLG